MRRRGGSTAMFVLYLILGIYFLNYGLNFFTVPDVLSKIDRWVVFLGGIFLVFGGINFLRLKRYTGYY